MLRRNQLTCLNPSVYSFKIFPVCYAVHTGSVCDIFAGRCSSTGNINSLLLPRSVYLCLTTTFMYFGELCTTSISEARFPKLSKTDFHLRSPLIFRVWCNHSAEYSPTSRSLWCLTKPAIKRRQLMNSQRRQLRNTSSVRWQKFPSERNVGAENTFTAVHPQLSCH